MATQSAGEIHLSDSDAESEPEDTVKKSEVSASQENHSGDEEVTEKEDEEESKPNEKSDEPADTEASVYTEQDLTEEGKKLIFSLLIIF